MTTELLAFAGLSPGELVIVGAVVLLLFGAQKIPQLMRSIGSGLTEFKKGVREGEKEAELPEAPVERKA